MKARRLLTLCVMLFCGNACKSKEPYEDAAKLLSEYLTTLGAANQALAISSEDLDDALVRYSRDWMALCGRNGPSLGVESPARPIIDACQAGQDTCKDKATCRAALAAIDQAITKVATEGKALGLPEDALPTAAIAASMPKPKAFIDSVKAFSAPRPALTKLNTLWMDVKATVEQLDSACSETTAEHGEVGRRAIPEGLNASLVESSVSVPYLGARARCASMAGVKTTLLMIENAKQLPKGSPLAAHKPYCEDVSRLASSTPASYTAQVATIEASCR